ncbi:hypothetical protein FRX31_002751 [Thalictrum thalictroides]|uniref:Uncharacterized protein n=1 Tax=Thalictrum thalictroides TaxID=46969 RepID=A0A7J6XFI8_THATH|nr:hypothetical protein FRX31_002751 [Thalictrum thalictroides]
MLDASALTQVAKKVLTGQDRKEKANTSNDPTKTMPTRLIEELHSTLSFKPLKKKPCFIDLRVFIINLFTHL